MVHFQTSSSWTAIKKFTGEFFNWIREHKVYLNSTRFKTDTLAPASFLEGAHTGDLRRNEAELELLGSLGLEESELPFQLIARTISIPLQGGQPKKFAFQAVVIETSAANANPLQEWLYALERPTTFHGTYPYTGGYQFTPLLRSKEWPLSKIYNLAQLHVSMINELRPIYLTNLQDLNNVADDDGDPLISAFLNMVASVPLDSGSLPQPLLHSIHNTGRATTKVAWVKRENLMRILTSSLI